MMDQSLMRKSGVLKERKFFTSFSPKYEKWEKKKKRIRFRGFRGVER